MSKQTSPEEIDINLVDSFSTLWRRRGRILLITGIFFLLGIFVAIFAPERFRSQCVFVPQVSQGLSGRYASLASLAGISLDLANSNDGQINPRVYPFILKHSGFQKELMYTEIHFAKAEQPITLYDYFTNDEYHKFNLFETVGKYTIGLPRIIAHNMAPKPTDVESQIATMLGGGETPSTLPVYSLTKKEYEVARIINRCLKLEVDSKKGYLTLTAKLPEAVASAELCEAAYTLIQKYVSEFKKAKSQANLTFIQSQLKDAKRDYERKQEQLARFMDSNKGSYTAKAEVERTRLKAECELAQQLYSELAKNELTSKMKVEENTVTYTELSPVSIPLKRYSPKRFRTVLIWTFVGFLFGCCHVAFRERLKSLNAAN